MLLLVEKGFYFGGGFDTIESNIVMPAHPDDELQVCSDYQICTWGWWFYYALEYSNLSHRKANQV